QSKRKPPRNADKVFWLQALGCRGAVVHRPALVLRVSVPPSPPPGGVAVSNVQPQGAIVGEGAPDLPEQAHEVRYILIDGRFRSDLPVDPVIPQPPVGRRRHDAIKMSFGHLMQDRKSVE